MKQILSGILAAAIALSLGATAAFAAGPGGGCHFADADGDGVCDVCGAYHSGAGTGNFVDTDGDGICDNYVYGQGCGYGHGGRGARACGFRGGRGK